MATKRNKPTGTRERSKKSLKRIRESVAAGKEPTYTRPRARGMVGKHGMVKPPTGLARELAKEAAIGLVTGGVVRGVRGLARGGAGAMRAGLKAGRRAVRTPTRTPTRSTQWPPPGKKIDEDLVRRHAREKADFDARLRARDKEYETLKAQGKEYKPDIEGEIYYPRLEREALRKQMKDLDDLSREMSRGVPTTKGPPSLGPRKVVSGDFGKRVRKKQHPAPALTQGRRANMEAFKRKSTRKRLEGNGKPKGKK